MSLEPVVTHRKRRVSCALRGARTPPLAGAARGAVVLDHNVAPPPRGVFADARRIVLVGYTVQLAHSSRRADLPCGRLGLLRGGKLHAVAEHVDSRQAKVTEAPHGPANPCGLACKRVLGHHVARQSDAVVMAPPSQTCRRQPERSVRLSCR